MRSDAQPSAAAPCGVCSYAKRSDCRYCRGGEPRTGPRFAPVDLVRGFTSYWRAALRLLNDNAYLGRIALAIALSVVAFVGLAAVALFVIRPLIADALGWEWLPGWARGATALVLTFVTGFFLFPVLVTLFLFPVLDPIARIAEREALGFEPPPHERGAVADFWDSLDTGARILMLQILAWLLCLPIALTGVFVPVAVAASAFFAGLSWLDYPASRRGLTFRAKWRIARRHWALLTGFGLGFLTGLLIPFFNLCLVGPAGAAGAAQLWLWADTGAEDLQQRP